MTFCNGELGEGISGQAYFTYQIAEEVPHTIQETLKDGGLTTREVMLLSGKIIECPLSGASEQLRMNIEKGKKILRYVQNVIPFSPNFPRRSKIWVEQGPSENRQKEIDNASATIDATRNKCTSIYQRDNRSRMLNYIEETEKQRTGRCGDMCWVGAKYAIDQFGIDFPIEIFGFKKVNHVFLMIDQGPNGVICDPWAGNCIPFSKIQDHMTDFEEDTIVMLGGLKQVVTKPLDLNKHPHILMDTPKKDLQDYWSNKQISKFIHKTIRFAVGLALTCALYTQTTSKFGF